MSWADRAACRGLSAELDSYAVFYPVAEKGNRSRAEALSEARELCASCPVRGDCLAEAMKYETGKYRYGFRGGLTEEERRVLAGARTTACECCGATMLAGRNTYCSNVCAGVARQARAS